VSIPPEGGAGDLHGRSAWPSTSTGSAPG